MVLYNIFNYFNLKYSDYTILFKESLSEKLTWQPVSYYCFMIPYRLIVWIIILNRNVYDK